MNYIILDTNFLHIRNHQDYFNFELNTSYSDLQGKIERRDLTNLFKILIPEIVFRELQKQKSQQFEQDYAQLSSLTEKFKNFSDFSFNLPCDFNYEEFLAQKISEYKSRNSIETIKIQNELHTFDKIIEKSIDKIPPFEGIEKKSDKGFKDALIWESLLNFAKNNPGNYYFYTKDNGFGKDLIQEFNQLATESEINFINDKNQYIVNDLIDSLSEERINSARLNNVEIEITKLLPKLVENLMVDSFNTFGVNNIPNYRLEHFDFPEAIFELTDISNSIFTFKCYCNLSAIKPGSTISMNISLDFLVKTISNNDVAIESIELESINAQTQDEDELFLNIAPFKMIIESSHRDKPLKSSTKKTSYLPNEKFNHQNVIKELDESSKSIINRVLSNYKISFYTQEKFDELYSIISNNAVIDWIHFDNKISSMNVSIKKFLNKNNITEPSKISNEIVNQLKIHYPK